MIKPLISLRFIFAILVFYHHLGLNADDSHMYKWLYDKVIAEAGMGLSFFFILSGFILTYNYKGKLAVKKETYYTFICGRIARIFPLHLFTLLAAVPLSLYQLLTSGQSYIDWILQFVFNLTLTQSFIPSINYYFSLNGPSWSISDELFFYSLFPLLIFWLVKFPKIFLTAFVPLLIITVPIMMIYSHPKSSLHYMYYINPLMRIADFILGICLFQLYSYCKGLKQIVNFTILEILSFVLLIGFLAFYHDVPLVFRYSWYYWLPMFLIILVFAFQKGYISHILSNRILVLLGDISFGFYLFHNLVIKYVLAINDRLHLIEYDFLVAGIILGITLLLSYFGYNLIEMPCQSYVKKKLLTLDWRKVTFRKTAINVNSNI